MIPDAYPPIQDGDFATPSLFNDRFLLAWQQVDALNAELSTHSDAISALSGRSFDDRYSLLSHNHDASYLKLSGGALTGSLIVPSLDVQGASQSVDFTTFDNASIGRVTRRVKRIAVLTSYTDILRLGTVGSYRITVAGADLSLGPRSMGFYEVMAVVSNDYMMLGAITKHLEVTGDGLDIRWVGATGSYSTTGAVLQIKTQQTTSNEWVVMVEEYARDARGNLTWLV